MTIGNSRLSCECGVIYYAFKNTMKTRTLDLLSMWTAQPPTLALTRECTMPQNNTSSQQLGCIIPQTMSVVYWIILLLIILWSQWFWSTQNKKKSESWTTKELLKYFNSWAMKATIFLCSLGVMVIWCNWDDFKLFF